MQAISSNVLAELKQTFLEAYDENSDGKIDIREVSSSCKQNNPEPTLLGLALINIVCMVEGADK